MQTDERPAQKIASGLAEALEIVKGEEPAARIVIAGHAYVPESALSTARAEGRREGLEEAAAAAYSNPDYVASLDRDKRGLLFPGSPYDRGRYEAAEAIRALAEDQS